MSHLGNTSDLETKAGTSDLIITHNADGSAHGMSAIGVQVVRAGTASAIRTLIGAGGGGGGATSLILSGTSTFITPDMKGKITIFHTGDSITYNTAYVDVDTDTSQIGDTYIFISGGVKVPSAGMAIDTLYHRLVFKASMKNLEVSGDVVLTSEGYTFMFGPPGSICVLQKGASDSSPVTEHWEVRGDSIARYLNTCPVGFVEQDANANIVNGLQFVNKIVRPPSGYSGDITYSISSVGEDRFPIGSAVTVSSAPATSLSIAADGLTNVNSCDGYFSGGSTHVTENAGGCIQIIRENADTYLIIGNVTSMLNGT